MSYKCRISEDAAFDDTHSVLSSTTTEPLALPMLSISIFHCARITGTIYIEPRRLEDLSLTLCVEDDDTDETLDGIDHHG